MLNQLDYFAAEDRRKDFLSQVENARIAQRVSRSPDYARVVTQEAKQVFLHATRFFRALANAGGSILFPARFAARR